MLITTRMNALLVGLKVNVSEVISAAKSAYGKATLDKSSVRQQGKEAKMSFRFATQATALASGLTTREHAASQLFAWQTVWDNAEAKWGEIDVRSLPAGLSALPSLFPYKGKAKAKAKATGTRNAAPAAPAPSEVRAPAVTA